MTGFSEINGLLHAEDVSLADIAARYQTPCYVYSAGHIRTRIAALQSAFKKALPAASQPLIAFACKANSNIALLHLMGQLGLGTDIVSGGELARSLQAGIPPNRIVFSGVGKTDEEILSALKQGILQINVESKPELERLAQLAQKAGKKAPVALRLNPDVDAKTHAKITTGKDENKFGIPPDEILSLYRWGADQPALHMRGLSMHIGSQLTELEPFRRAFEKMAALVNELRAENLSVTALDLGGGIGVVYRDESNADLDGYAALVRDIIHPLKTEIILEPGRLLVAEAGVLLTRVLYVKEGKKRRYLILDAGMNDLMRPALYESYHAVRPVDMRAARNRTTYDIVGPVCETGDTFGKDRELPEMKAGELAAIMLSGAYGFSMASHYNARIPPAEILVDGARHALIRQRDNLNDILKKEFIPDWLEEWPDARSA